MLGSCRRAVVSLLGLALATSCGGDSGTRSGPRSDAGSSAAGGGPGGASSGGGGTVPVGGSAGASAGGGAQGSGGAAATGGVTGTGSAGNAGGARASGGAPATGGSMGTGAATASDGGTPPPPIAVCALPAKLADVSKPATVVGDGTPGSCTEAALRAALVTGGVVTFDCGAAPRTITVTTEVSVKKDTVIDGKGLVTLSGGGTTRILHLASAWNLATPLLTVQNLRFVDGFTTDVVNTKSTAKGGAAIFEDGGSLTVIDCAFSNNHCAATGQDVSGGAINGQGVGKLVVQGSTFDGNSGANGGAVGTQANDVTIVNSTFSNNAATGTDGNPGNGGDGGALSYDGAKVSLSFCGDRFTGNHAGAQGGAIFRVAYGGEPTNVDRCTFDGNSADATVGLAGALYLENTTITMTATTISNNKSHYGGGIWVGQSAIANFTNVTIANNSSDQGGGLWFASQVTGTFRNCTVAGNTSAYGDAIFTGTNAVKLENCLFATNDCKEAPFVNGGVNLAFTAAGCTTGALASDPKLGPLQDNGGPTKTMAPAAGSPALGKGTACPATDQRGTARASGGCTLGAYEAG